ncbi:MAG: mechanosensitive ion channel domain-containing protein, partial [Planctomycetota bacterium]
MPRRWIVVLALAVCALATGQESEPIRQELEQRLAEARELPVGDGDGSRRETLIGCYTTAIAALDATAQWSARADELRAEAELAPARAAELEERLAADDVPGPSLDGASVEELDRRAKGARAERDLARAELERLEAAVLGAPERKREIAERRAELATRIEGFDVALRAGALEGEDAELAAARLAQARAQRTAAEAHVEALRVEEQTDELRTDVLSLDVRVARRDVSRAEASVAAIEEALVAERLAVTERRKKEAEESRRAALEQGPAFSEAAEGTLALRERSVAVAKELESLGADLAQRRSQLEGLERRFDETRRRVEIVGLSNPISLLLRQEQRRLIEARASGVGRRDVQQELTDTQLELLDRAIELDALDDRTWIDGLVEAATDGETSEVEAREIAEELYRDRYDAVRANRDILETQFDRLLEIDVAGGEIAERLDAYEEYVEERVLWIRSARPVWKVPPAAYADEVRTAGSFEEWSEVASALRREARRRPVFFFGTIVLVLGLFAGRTRVRRALRYEADLARQRRQVSILPTLRAVGWSAFLVIGFAAPLVAFGILLRASFVDEALVAALGLACERAIAAALILGSLRVLALPDGLGDAHFGWPDRVIALVRSQATRLMPIVPAAALVGDFLVNVDTTTGSDAVARLAFFVEGGSILYFIHRLLHPSRGVLALSVTGSSSQELLFRLRRVWYLAAVGVSAALLALAFLGYGFTARSLLGRLELTFAFVLALIVVRAIALRWIMLVRRNEALERRQKRREEELAKRLAEIERRRKAGEEVDDVDSEGLVVEEETPDFAAMSQDVRDLVRLLTGFAAFAGVLAIWTAVLPALGFFDRIRLWQREGSLTEYVTGVDGSGEMTTRSIVEWVTLGDIGLAVLVLFATWIAIRNVTSVLELLLFRRFQLGSGERYAIATLVKYLITLIGLAVAFQEIGLSWGKLQWLVAGVSVGLGFGLQEIFANFISGITLLFERPVRVGDWVTLDDVEGVVSKIRIRATTIRDRDLKELIVPNREFITGRFINWTLSDPVSRIVVPVGIAYGSDTELAITRLLEAGR